MLPGETHDYKFLVGGDWALDPECHDTTSNEFETKTTYAA
jgi:hypothetical protein